MRWQVLNSKDFGVPQNRERVFLIAVLRSRGGREILPVTGEVNNAVIDPTSLSSKPSLLPCDGDILAVVRERVFLIAVLRSRGGREILPVTGEDGGALKEVIGGMQGYRILH